MKVVLMVLALALAGCVMRPEGEQAERDRVAAAGVAFHKPFAERELPDLAQGATLSTFLAHAEQTNGALEAAFHSWEAALEKVPQASTQATTAMVGLEHTLDGGSALDRTALLLMNNTMAMILWPGRLEAQGEAALADARVAGAAFVRERLRLQTQVSDAYYALALRDEELGLLDRLERLLAVQVPSVAARVRAGSAMQAELLAAEVARDRVQAERAKLAGERPALEAALRAIAGLDGDAMVTKPVLPPLTSLRPVERDVIESVLANNAEVEMQRLEHAAAMAEVTMAEWERVPEFSLSATVMGTMSQTLGAAMTLPWLRGTAIEGAVRESEARVRAADALRRQAGADAIAMAVRELAMLAAVEAEHAVLAESLLPRLRQMGDVARAAWTAGGGKLTEWVAATAMALETETALARLRRDHSLARARLQELLGGVAP
ncbi:MAG: TolC family protein [Planctomycetes bacterium]|nr:TolC family protein [Planctomycetota bacterium]